MSELKEYIDPNSLEEFLRRDERRILESFFNDPEAIGKEVVLFTERMCWLVKFDNFKKGYKELFKRFRANHDTSRMWCKKVEFIPPVKDCGIMGAMFQFKLTFVK